MLVFLKDGSRIYLNPYRQTPVGCIELTLLFLPAVNTWTPDYTVDNIQLSLASNLFLSQGQDITIASLNLLKVNQSDLIQLFTIFSFLL